jgi:S-adenosylmethionine decarboxylase
MPARLGVAGLRLAATLLADLVGCRVMPGHESDMRPWVMDAVKSAGMRTFANLGLDFPQAHWHDAYGASCIGLVVPLAESHICLHTWPERDRRVLIDFTTCGPLEQAERAIRALAGCFEPREAVFHTVIARGE